ncbi:DUF2244 domain-containing protein [Oleiagrimonas sp. C23AA]|uniref:DUF2244 domain-containing protein n=1 Tax=Oleiagrimonas sp. C23AA TaxID=2719047 RepID=UPI00142075CE|nr:DUF2244 domain-containing protein [Oleiagrimonas sp. C23AA]NII11362.1 DUF2244 domain-containing protein [Oleiagrimonas sp. C23AA]
MWLRPNRSLSYRGLKCWIGALVGVVLTVGVLGAHQGNVFAPVFALAESVALVVSLGVVWRSGERGQRITVDTRQVEVEFLPGHARTCFQSYWVRVQMLPGHPHRRLMLASHGRELEVGAFLVEDERTELSNKLKNLLVELTRYQPNQVQSFQGAR